jgi:hypothetical protein
MGWLTCRAGWGWGGGEHREEGPHPPSCINIRASTPYCNVAKQSPFSSAKGWRHVNRRTGPQNWTRNKLMGF